MTIGRSANARGVAAVLGGTALFALSDTLVKLASRHIPASEIMAVRGVAALALALALAAPHRARLRALLEPKVAVRSLLEAIVAVLWLAALPHMALGDISAIQQLTPIALVVLSALLFREPVNPQRWLAVVAGLVGVLLIVQPSAHGVSLPTLLALGCALGVAVRDLITRRLDPSLPTPIVTVGAALTVCLAGFSGAGLERWRTPDPTVLLWLAGSALIITGANTLIISGFRWAETSLAAPFRYAGVLWAILLGWLVFGTFPSLAALTGVGILIAAGIYVLR